MKLLFTLLLLCFVGYSLSSNCFTGSNQLNGFSTNYNMIAYNLNNGLNQGSYLQSGQIEVDNLGQTIYSSLTISDSNGSTFIETFQFGKNNTQYFIVNGNDNLCYYQKQEFQQITFTPISDSDITIGGTPVSLFQVNDPSTSVSFGQTLYVNEDNCAFYYIESKNTNNNGGGALTTFFNFSFDLYGWSVPASCSNAEPIKQEHANKLNRVLRLL